MKYQISKKVYSIDFITIIQNEYGFWGSDKRRTKLNGFENRKSQNHFFHSFLVNKIVLDIYELSSYSLLQYTNMLLNIYVGTRYDMIVLLGRPGS